MAPGWGWWGHDEVTQQQVDMWDDLKEKVDPTYHRPPPVEPKSAPVPKGLGHTSIPTPEESDTAKVGLGPQAPIAARGSGARFNTATITDADRQKARFYLNDHGLTNPTPEQIATTIASGEYKNQDYYEPPVPPGRVAVYDSSGKARGSIPNTPQQVALARSHGLVTRTGTDVTDSQK